MSYKKLGEYIQQVNERNRDLETTVLLGVSITKKLIPSIANTIGTDMSVYKIIKRRQFAYGTVTSRNGEKISIALADEYEKALVSQIYVVFEVVDTTFLLPEYLMMWFSRPEFDRYARYHSHGSTRETFDWADLCETELPIPSIEEQIELVKQYYTISDKIKVNEQICEKLETTAQTLYKHWFVDCGNEELVFIKDYIESNPSLPMKKGMKAKYTEMRDLSENHLSIKQPIIKEYMGGSRFQNFDTLFARITPCLENGKTGFVNYLVENEIAFGSTEFIVIRPKFSISPYWVYCLCKDENFRTYAISTMIGSSGRQRVHESYLLKYKYPRIDEPKMMKFDLYVKSIFQLVKNFNNQIHKLAQLQSLLLSRLATLEVN
ncbi:restriction endonuclease subunit S [Kaistella carnis]|uniref:restriction endonuclease subunit S n=1 Tax=Kaistella carnis TaxID=1241979 RepID=UPI0016289519|nr:restriction endonuclease subunit S [Kaistella carnis]